MAFPFKGNKKSTCGAAVCPRPNKKAPNAEELIKMFNYCEDPKCNGPQDKNVEGMKQNIETLENILSNLTGLCKEPTCPTKEYLEKKLDVAKKSEPALDKKKTPSSVRPLPCPPNPCAFMDEKEPPPPPPCSSGYARIVKELQELKDLAGQGICKSPACYNAYMGYYSPDFKGKVCGSTSCVAGGKGCGSAYCPFIRNPPKQPSPDEETDCGGMPCPIDETGKPLPISICGRDSCPFANKGANAPCGNEVCPFGTKPECPKDESCMEEEIKSPSFCGGEKCPFSPPAEKPYYDTLNPYAPRTGKNTCPYGGVPLCPYGGTIQTHKYSADKYFVSEASRPYSGSASPYDYLGSLEKSYKTENIGNYPLFSYTAPPVIPPCPYLSNKIKKTECTKPDCPFKMKQKPDNFCIVSTCPLKEPPVDTIIDNSKRRPSTKSNKSKEGGDDINNYPVSNPETENTSKDGDENNGELKANGDNKCSKTTCPYIKKLIFCDDCGGVVPEKDAESQEECIIVPENLPLEVLESIQEVTESEIKDESTNDKNEAEGSALSIKKQNANKAKSTKAIKQKEEKAEKASIDKSDEKPIEKVKNCDSISIYSYPGIQMGHKDCKPQRPIIPGNMGWLWNSRPPFGVVKRWRGYKPGAVSRPVYEIIQKHRRDLGLSDDSNDAKKKRSKMKFKMEDLKHYIEVKKRLGDYTITVNPVKDPQITEPYENPFMDVTPMQFKIEKEKKEKENDCPCDDDLEEKAPSTDSEFEFMFSPPAAIPDTKMKKKKIKKTIDTQYDPKDLIVEKKGKRGSKRGSRKGSKRGSRGSKRGSRGSKRGSRGSRGSTRGSRGSQSRGSRGSKGRRSKK